MKSIVIDKITNSSVVLVFLTNPAEQEDLDTLNFGTCNTECDKTLTYPVLGFRMGHRKDNVIPCRQSSFASFPVYLSAASSQNIIP